MDLHLRAIHLDPDAAVSQGLETRNVLTMPVDRIPLMCMDIYPVSQLAPIQYPFYPIIISPTRLTKVDYDKYTRIFMRRVLPEMVIFDVKAPGEVRLRNKTPQNSATNSVRYRQQQLSNQNNKVDRSQIRAGYYLLIYIQLCTWQLS